MQTNNYIDLNKYKIVANIGYSGRSYMLKELSTGEIYVAKIFINLDIFSCVKEKERKFHISSKINKIAIFDHPAIIKLIRYSPKTLTGLQFQPSLLKLLLMDHFTK